MFSVKFTKKGWPAQTEEVFKPFSKQQEELTAEGGCLTWGIRDIVPKKYSQIFCLNSNRNNPRICQIKALARICGGQNLIDKDLEAVAKSCLSCQSVKQTPAVAPLQPWLWPTKPWQCVHVDFLGPFQGKMFMVAVDAHSKLPEIEMSSTTVANTVTVMRKWFTIHGLPEDPVSSNGHQFRSADFSEFMKEIGMKHTLFTVHPTALIKWCSRAFCENS